MKKLFSPLVCILFFVSCQDTNRSVGYTNWSDDDTQYKYHLGTESSIEVVKKFDKLVQEKKYDKLRKIFNDTVTFTYYNGVKNTLDEFIDLNVKRDSSLLADQATLKWESQSIFSLDLDPSSGGEHVNMLYLTTYENKEETSQFYANLWFYVINGKIANVNQFNQRIATD